MDEYFVEAGRFIIKKDKASIGMLQRAFKIGFNRAAKIMDELCYAGVVEEEWGTIPRKIIMNLDEFERLIKNQKIEEKIKEQKIGKTQKQEFITKNFSKIDAMSGVEFEKFCANILKSDGYENIEFTKLSGDFGIDILTNKDKISYAIQCKRYKNAVGISAIQEAYSGAKYYNANYAMVITNNYFTDAAKELSKKIRVVLKDRDYIKDVITRISKSENQKGLDEKENQFDIELIKKALKECTTKIYNLFWSFGIKITFVDLNIKYNEIILGIVPAKGIRVKTILSYKQDIELSLGCNIKMSLVSEKGYIGIFIQANDIIR